MPGTTRYSATFDRTYEEEDNLRAEPPVSRRSRSQSLQVESLSFQRRQTPPSVGSQGSHSRSSSIENGTNTTGSGGTAKGAAGIPTRTAGKPTVKPHNNPFQFVKVGTCPLYKKAEEQLKKAEQVKKPAVLKEEEEWQSNLDSWKSRRRKMSESTIRRQEEIRKLEMEEQQTQNNQQQQQKKTKTFTEIVEERGRRGRALSLCMFSNPLESNEWVFENKRSLHRKSSFDPLQLSEESAESSNINSEDDTEIFQKHLPQEHDPTVNKESKNVTDKLNGSANGVQTSTSSSSISKNSDLSELDVSQESISQKEQNLNGGYVDSGLESLSSSHRAGDIPDSGSDFSQDSGGSSIGSDSPRVSGLTIAGMELLEELGCSEELLKCAVNNHKEKTHATVSDDSAISEDINTKSKVEKSQSAKIAENKKVCKGKVSKVKCINGENQTRTKVVSKNDVDSKTKNSEANTTDKKQNNRSKKASDAVDFGTIKKERSIESENEMYVDDFDELARLQVAENCLDKPEILDSSHQSNRKTATSNIPCESPVDCKAPFSESSINVIYQSLSQVQALPSDEPAQKNCVTKEGTNNSSADETPFSLIGEVPVDKVTEEMERLILQQLEEEERAKEMSNAKCKNDNVMDIEVPPKCAEPPKEKPPPPPSTATSPPKGNPKKDPSLKRVNSTKRILNEIHKRRSDFLGIEKPSDLTTCTEHIAPPPSALEELLKVKQEERISSNLASLSYSDEDDIARKEREIIENVEKEEKLKSSQSGSSLDFSFANVDTKLEEERIKKLKEERKRIEEERLLADEQKARLEEAKLLQMREQKIREQEANDETKTTCSAPSYTSVALNSNTANATTDSVPSAKGKIALSKNGDGIDNQCSVPSASSKAELSSKAVEGPPPSTTAKPLKKKEALRKERERLRHEQEALQREREEHRKKLLLEQEQSKKVVQKSNGSSQAHSKSASRQTNGVAMHPKISTMETKAKQKVPLVRKQSEPTGGSRYNQNHWLIQEAEMRRIAEQSERQHNHIQAGAVQNSLSAYPPNYVDAGVSKPLQRPNALPIAQNMNTKHTSYAMPMQYSPDKQWNYGPQVHHSVQNNSKCLQQTSQVMGFDASQTPVTYSSHLSPPAKPSRVIPFDKPEQILSVSGRKRCSHCGEELGRGAAMIIESLQLYYHILCFQCCVCQAQLGNGSCGTDVRVRNNKLHCHNCYSNDEAGLKFSQV